MPIFLVQITKSIPSQGIDHFGNRYLVQATDLDDAQLAVDPIVLNEKRVHTGAVDYLMARVSDLVVGTDVFATIPLSGSGTLAISVDNLPAGLVAVVDVRVVGGGRPSRKFYHGCVGEEHQNNGLWDSTYTAAVNDAINDMIADVTTAGQSLVDPDNQAWLVAQVKTRVGFHQFHKRSKRPATP